MNNRSHNKSGISTQGRSRNLRSNLRSNIKSKEVSKHFTDIQQDNVNILGSLLEMDDPDFGRHEPVRRSATPKKRDSHRKTPDRNFDRKSHDKVTQIHKIF